MPAHLFRSWRRSPQEAAASPPSPARQPAGGAAPGVRSHSCKHRGRGSVPSWCRRARPREGLVPARWGDERGHFVPAQERGMPGGRMSAGVWCLSQTCLRLGHGLDRARSGLAGRQRGQPRHRRAGGKPPLRAGAHRCAGVRRAVSHFPLIWSLSGARTRTTGLRQSLCSRGVPGGESPAFHARL